MADSEEAITTERFAVNYDLLFDLASFMHDLAEDAKTGGMDGEWATFGDLDDDEHTRIFGDENLGHWFRFFFNRSKARVEDGVKGLNDFGDSYEGLARVMYEQDGAIAATMLSTLAKMKIDQWVGEQQAYDDWVTKNDNWNAYLEDIGAADYMAAHPDQDIGTVCSAEDAPEWCGAYELDLQSDIDNLNGINDRVPPQPGEEPEKPADAPPNELTLTDALGNTVTTTVEYDDDYNIIAEQSDFTSHTGQTYTTTTEYDGPPSIVAEQDVAGENSSNVPGADNTWDQRDHTVTNTSADGTVTVDEYVINDSDSENPGAGTWTSTVTSTNDDGEEEVEVTEYTRDGPDAEWVEVGDSDDDGEDDEPHNYSNDKL
ncbi:hypothetical protein [Streptomyces sp. RFCAC02]|uniref:hypothetical protein n=1 Tax=Streptomyces sp. RFCAC02 TaxID=2499143 RepID=UPI00101FB0A5|nr:hypothetical protein [Streptomyces sp. RFCAC02]